MHIYEYVCPECGESFEKLVRSGSKAREMPVTCPNCGHESHRKTVTLIASAGPGGGMSLGSASASCAPSG